MILQLKCPSCQMPPGGFPFRDPKTQRTWKGYEWFYDNLAKDVIRHRMENPHVYNRNEVAAFDYNSVVQEIFQQKYATHPEIFIGHGGEVKVSDPTKCRMCGSTEEEPIFCPTCSGQRVIGAKCKKCGHQKR